MPHPSKTAAYAWIRDLVRDFGPGGYSDLRSSVVKVYVDERDGQGWQLYESIDLRDLVLREAK